MQLFCSEKSSLMVQNLCFSGFDDNYKFCEEIATYGLFFKRPLIRFSLPNFI